MFYIFLFIANRNVRRRKIVAPPLELNDAIVSDVERFKTISCKRLESFFIKSRINVFVLEPAPKRINIAPLLLGQRFPVLFSF